MGMPGMGLDLRKKQLHLAAIKTTHLRPQGAPMGTAPMPGRSKAGFDDGHDGLMVTPQIDEAAETRSPGFSVFFL